MGEPTKERRSIEGLGSSLREVLAEAAKVCVPSDEELAAFDASLEREARAKRLAGCGVDDYLEDHARQGLISGKLRGPGTGIVQTWMATHTPCLALFGPTGTGKTVSAAWALARITGRYLCAPDLCDLYVGGVRQRSEYRLCVDSPLLVIDELGTELDAGVAAAVLHDVVNRRQTSRRRTILLGNLSRAAFVARYDARTLDRLGIGTTPEPHEDLYGICWARRLGGASLRRRVSVAAGQT